MAKGYKYIYGPVPSWRLGRSLGVDPISMLEKICPFNCTYCQLGDSVKYETERKIFVPTDGVIGEISSLPEDVAIDYITFSGRGEPTLAKNLGEMMEEIRKIWTEPIAILTDSSLIDREDVQADLAKMDFVMAKLDAPDESLFKTINRPAPGIRFDAVIEGLRAFRKAYTGKFALQIMFVGSNKAAAGKIAELARELDPDEVQLNTPLRPCAEKPLSKSELEEVEREFEGLKVVNVYEGLHREVRPISTKDALYRRGKRL